MKNLSNKEVKPKPKKKLYFGPEVQEAIIQYNDSNNPTFRNRVYRDEIHAAFDKLAENIINTFKFSYFDYGFEDIKNEVTSFLVLNIVLQFLKKWLFYPLLWEVDIRDDNH